MSKFISLELHERLQNKYQNLENNYNSLSDKCQQEQEQKQIQTQQLAIKKQEIKNQNQELTMAKETIQQLKIEKQNWQQQEKEDYQKLKSLQTQLAQTKNENSSFIREISSLRKQRDDWMKNYFTLLEKAGRQNWQQREKELLTEIEILKKSNYEFNQEEWNSWNNWEIEKLTKEKSNFCREKLRIQTQLNQVKKENKVKNSLVLSLEKRATEAEENLQSALEEITKKQDYIKELEEEKLSSYNEFSAEYALVMEDFYKRQGVNTGDYQEHLKDYSFFKKFKEQVSQDYLTLNQENRELKQHNQDLEEQVKAILQLKKVEFSRLKEIEFREIEAQIEATLPGSWKTNYQINTQ